jgi:hypothetical protein
VKYSGSIYRKYSLFSPSLGELVQAASCGGGGGLFSKFDNVQDKYLARVCDLCGKCSCRTFSTGSRCFERRQETRNLRKGGGICLPDCRTDDCMLTARISRLVSYRLEFAAGSMTNGVKIHLDNLLSCGQRSLYSRKPQACLHVGPANVKDPRDHLDHVVDIWKNTILADAQKGCFSPSKGK